MDFSLNFVGGLNASRERIGDKRRVHGPPFYKRLFFFFFFIPIHEEFVILIVSSIKRYYSKI